MNRSIKVVVAAASLVALAISVTAPAAAADAAFTRWLEGIWPDAQQMGVARKTFEAATRALSHFT